MSETKTRIGGLFDLYGSDKARNGYDTIYETIFRHWCPNSLLEVGLGTMIPGVPSSMVGYGIHSRYQPGASLRAWRDYFPQAKIYGLDVQKDCIFQEDRIRTALGDSTSKESLVAALSLLECGTKSIDAIIDDGLHTSEAQLATMKNLLPYVRLGGVYIVEDVYQGSPFIEQAENAFPELASFCSVKKNLVIFLVDR